MHLSMWTYPWDVQDLSHDRVAGEFADAGLNTVSLATSYHAGRFLQPRSPRRKAYFPEDGTLYFKPTPARWEGLAIQPKLADVIRDGGDVLGELVRRRDAGGPAVSCWTVCLHNTRIGMLHPEVATRNAFGDPSYFSLCPSHPDARAYVTALVEDLSHAYRPDIIELESPSFMGFAHGYHHEKDGVGLTAEDDFLLSLCFCDACLARAARSGIDGRRARERVKRWIAETCEREVPQPRWPDFPAAGLDVFKPYPDLHDYLTWRFEPVTSLIAEMRERTHPDTRLYLIDLKDGWLGGCDLAAAGAVCDGVILCAYDMSPPQVTALLRGGRQAVGPDKFVGAGFRVFYPEMQGAADLVERVRAAAAAGADGLNFYNYGLIPQARLDWVRQAISAAQEVHLG
ncbi:hypothetical protein [Labrys monachus]|nr:hypothetical protein [Labrys monachus]